MYVTEQTAATASPEHEAPGGHPRRRAEADPDEPAPVSRRQSRTAPADDARLHAVSRPDHAAAPGTRSATRSACVR